jgi:hypothetical protein
LFPDRNPDYQMDCAELSCCDKPMQDNTAPYYHRQAEQEKRMEPLLCRVVASQVALTPQARGETMQSSRLRLCFFFRGWAIPDKLIGHVAAACFLVFLALLATPVLAQRAPTVVDGNLWLQSSPEVRKAFLVGASSMLAMEAAYAKKKGTPPSVAGTMASQAMDRVTLDDISNRITRWYEANPDRRTMPVMGVIWVDIVQPGSAKK